MFNFNVGLLLAASLFVSALGLAEPADFQLPPAPIRKGVPAEDRPDDSYVGLDKAATAFLIEWFGDQDRPFPKLGVAVHREIDGDRFKLAVVHQSKQTYKPDNRRWSWNQNPGPVRGGYWEKGRWPHAEGQFDWRSESSMTFDPRSQTQDSDRSFSFSTRSERRSPDGFDRESSYSRSYSRTQTSPNPAPQDEVEKGESEMPAAKPPVGKVEVKRAFSPDPIGRLFFYDDADDWESVKSQLKKQHRLIHAGTTTDGLIYFVLIK